MSATYKLIYFPVMGRGECIRYIFAMANQDYEEQTIEKDNWMDTKQDFPFKQLPVLEVTVDGKTHVIAQHMTICRYLARKFGLSGDDAFEEAKADMLVDACNQLWNQLQPICMTIMGIRNPEEKQYELSKAFLEIEFKAMMEIFANHINSEGFLVGNKVTWADLYIAEFVSRMMQLVDEKALDNHPKMKQFVEKINDIPQIKKRIEKRPNMVV